MSGLCLTLLAGCLMQAPEGEPGKKQGKQQKGPYGLPSVQDLKEKLKLTPEQCKKVIAVYKEYQSSGGPKEGGMQPGPDQGKEFKKKHDELVAKINAFLTEEQKDAFKKLLESQRKEMMKKKEGGP